MNKVYYLSTCTTCKRIMDELGPLLDSFERQDVKYDQMTLDQIDEMKEIAGSYESLFSRKAMKYRAMGLGERTLSEEDYRKLIHEEYTFLKRPVFIIDDRIFIGSVKKNIEALTNYLNEIRPPAS